jgi:hypothetical protein
MNKQTEYDKPVVDGWINKVYLEHVRLYGKSLPIDFKPNERTMYGISCFLSDPTYNIISQYPILFAIPPTEDSCERWISECINTGCLIKMNISRDCEICDMLHRVELYTDKLYYISHYHKNTCNRHVGYITRNKSDSTIKCKHLIPDWLYHKLMSRVDMRPRPDDPDCILYVYNIIVLYIKRVIMTRSICVERCRCIEFFNAHILQKLLSRSDDHLYGRTKSKSISRTLFQLETREQDIQWYHSINCIFNDIDSKICNKLCALSLEIAYNLIKLISSLTCNIFPEHITEEIVRNEYTYRRELVSIADVVDFLFINKITHKYGYCIIKYYNGRFFKQPCNSKQYITQLMDSCVSFNRHGERYINLRELVHMIQACGGVDGRVMMMQNIRTLQDYIGIMKIGIRYYLDGGCWPYNLLQTRGRLTRVSLYCMLSIASHLPNDILFEIFGFCTNWINNDDTYIRYILSIG